MGGTWGVTGAGGPDWGAVVQQIDGVAAGEGGNLTADDVHKVLAGAFGLQGDTPTIDSEVVNLWKQGKPLGPDDIHKLFLGAYP